ncbi:ethanolaminephosphotransferase 1-like isoform X2 [Ptychodera flava]|uniref:ethanolaminephosphotransferase 1-like isoform X2 n=1 Tax=Ptychodera flava TaxID=63121 RepID=UPI003969BF3C
MAKKYLTDEQIAGFDKYKYSAVDTSPVSIYITHPFWNQLVKLVPLWIAPNVLTLAGFIFLIVAYVLLLIYDPDYLASSRNYPDSEPVPQWVWFACGLCQFLSHNLDGIDGKQARRTQSSSPLGELFDHGIDSWSILFLPVAVFSIFSRDRADYGETIFVMYWVVWNIEVCFIISHWEKYNTGVLFLPWGYDVSQIGMTLVYLITGVYGIECWKGAYFGWFEFRVLFLLCVYAGTFLVTLPQSFYNVYRSYVDKTGKMRSFSESVRPLVSATILFSIATVWAYKSPYGILDNNPRLFFWLLGTSFSNITCRLIVSQMSSTRADLFNILLLPFTAVAAICVTFDIGVYELYLTWALTLLVTAAHLHYCVCVVIQMCDHFNIYCFTITKKPSKKKEKNVLQKHDTF